MVLAGDFDLASAAEVRRVGLELLSTGCARLLVDLMDVPFMDSTGLGTLIALKLSAEQAGIPFLLLDPSDRVVRLLEVTAMTQWFAVGRFTT